MEPRGYVFVKQPSRSLVRSPRLEPGRPGPRRVPLEPELHRPYSRCDAEKGGRDKVDLSSEDRGNRHGTAS